MAGFLLLIGLTGSLLVFWQELNELLAPRLYPGHRPGVALSAGALALRAEALVPEARARTVYLGYRGTVWVGVEPRPGTAPLGYNYIYLDPVTGQELGKVNWGAWPTTLEGVMPFVYQFHENLVMGSFGARLLGIVALIWTVDCFIAFCLTLPRPSPTSDRTYLRRWRPAWLVKVPAPSFRLNFDLHRAGGLWPWAMLLVLAWSSVYLNLRPVYTAVTSPFLPYEPSIVAAPAEPRPRDWEPMGWAEAQATAVRLMDDQAREHGFTVERPMALYLVRRAGVFEYRVRSSRDVGDKYGSTSIYFDASSGALRQLRLPTGQAAGNTVATWLLSLHMANVFGLPFRVLVFVVGLGIAMLSVTGVTIWLQKRRARRARS
jgi:uncharacterized iron-regulated membrane protein